MRFLDRVSRLSTEDGAATLAALTAACVAAAARHFPEPPARWLVCGGGRRNRAVMAMLAARTQRAGRAGGGGGARRRHAGGAGLRLPGGAGAARAADLGAVAPPAVRLPVCGRADQPAGGFRVQRPDVARERSYGTNMEGVWNAHVRLLTGRCADQALLAVPDWRAVAGRAGALRPRTTRRTGSCAGGRRGSGIGSLAVVSSLATASSAARRCCLELAARMRQSSRVAAQATMRRSSPSPDRPQQPNQDR